MSESMVFTVIRTKRTTAVLSAVVLLLTGIVAAGCRHHPDHPGKHGSAFKENRQMPRKNKPIRRRAKDYSRLPGNYPATWQTSTIGN